MIAVLGEVLVDIIRRPGFPDVEVVGGGPFNTARAAARLGAEVTFVCPVSTDERGERIARALAEDHIRAGISERSNLPTALAHASIDAGGHATYEFELHDTALDSLTRDAALSAVSGADAVHVGTLALALGGMADVVVDVVGQLGPETLLMVDPNCRPVFLDGNRSFAHAWPVAAARADVIKISDEDLRYLHGNDDEAALAALRRQSNGLILITRGADGVTVVGGDQTRQVHAPRVEVVDTVGAGDTFSGAFLAFWANRGLGVPDLLQLDLVCEAVEFAAAAAALTCTKVGAHPPKAAEVQSWRFD